MTIEDMAKAHLDTVKKAVQDLILQKEKVDVEIKKLQQYITTGENVIKDYNHVSGSQEYDDQVFRSVN